MCPGPRTAAGDSLQDDDVTRLLDRWCGGDIEAFHALVPLVYDELRKLANHYLRDERQGTRCSRRRSCTKRFYGCGTSAI